MCGKINRQFFLNLCTYLFQMNANRWCNVVSFRGIKKKEEEKIDSEFVQSP